MALDRLWKEHRRWLAVVLLAHMPREGELEDLLQEVALKVVAGIQSLEDPAQQESAAPLQGHSPSPEGRRGDEFMRAPMFEVESLVLPPRLRAASPERGNDGPPTRS